MPLALLLAAIAAAVLAAAGSSALLRDHAPTSVEAAPGPSSPNQMALDVDVNTPGVQVTFSSVGTSVFTVAIVVTQAVPYRLYDAFVGYPEAGLSFTGS